MQRNNDDVAGSAEIVFEQLQRKVDRLVSQIESQDSVIVKVRSEANALRAQIKVGVC